MAEELVVWIDEKENVLGPIPISLANSDPKYLHPEVAVVIIDDKKRALLQKRAKTKKVAPGIWTITAAGHITYGDTSEMSAHRELTEEMGISVNKLYPIFKKKESLEHETHLIHWYLGVYRGDKIVIQESEVETYAWVSQTDFEEFISKNNVSKDTQSVLYRLWSGEWDHLLK
ncbi:MAG: hypothetical protein DPW11_00420 [bacterium]|nr:NUDIX domain-containing protein [Candidatus Microgenomates bacterium CPR3]MCQ3944232.1 hypothetical protein [bacterium]RIK51754.1 MAG: hypothetical protein DCC61_01600 [Candidatus Microgenomates bacterium]